MKNHLPWVAVLGVVMIGFAMIARRQQSMEQRLVELERRGPKGGFIVPEPETGSPMRVVPPVEIRPQSESTPIVPDSKSRSLPATPRLESVPIELSGETLTPSQQGAVAREVERIMKEKYGNSPMFHAMEEPLVVMERELNLTPYQKERIAASLKERQEEMMKQVESEEKFPSPKELMESEKRSEAAIKAVLSLEQQARYDELKKEGKLFGGMMIKLGTGTIEKNP